MHQYGRPTLAAHSYLRPGWDSTALNKMFAYYIGESPNMKIQDYYRRENSIQADQGTFLLNEAFLRPCTREAQINPCDPI
jgi:hypothetical protein